MQKIKPQIGQLLSHRLHSELSVSSVADKEEIFQPEKIVGFILQCDSYAYMLSCQLEWRKDKLEL